MGLDIDRKIFLTLAYLYFAAVLGSAQKLYHRKTSAIPKRSTKSPPPAPTKRIFLNVIYQKMLMTKANHLRSSVLVLVMLAAVFVSGYILFGSERREIPPEISNIIIDPINDGTVRITWNTNKETYGGVYLIEQNNEILTQEAIKQPSKSHSVTIKNLPSSKEYVFDVGAEFYGTDGLTDVYSHKRVTFKMP